MKHQKLITTPEISKRMSHVGLKRNKYEKALAKKIWHMGYRYRLNYKTLPGSPDIAILKYNLAIFVDGEFWHGKDFHERISTLTNNKSYWIEKIKENRERDRANDEKLKQLGWIPIHFWSKDIVADIDYCIDTIIDFISFQKDGKYLDNEI